MKGKEEEEGFRENNALSEEREENPKKKGATQFFCESIWCRKEGPWIRPARKAPGR